jgi:hypothetical protein
MDIPSFGISATIIIANEIVANTNKALLAKRGKNPHANGIFSHARST